jgi:hypothetical protein
VLEVLVVVVLVAGLQLVVLQERQILAVVVELRGALEALAALVVLELLFFATQVLAQSQSVLG